ncbi:MAG TPA: hypothetical protein VMR46_03085 [Candidatus Paceibacterota bacterium]|jgi:hypothetical protein|nr:hypothetical protein [Candidatus Paceibacterota bacterium]
MEEEIGLFVGFIFLALFAAGVLGLFGFNFGHTLEGTVDYSNCQQIIAVQDNDWYQKYFHTWTCDAIKTKSGEIMGGECALIEKDNSYPTPQCARAYVYEMATSTACEGNIVNGIAYTYLGYDDMCHTTPQ